ncbi:ParA family protein [Brevundimonas subvibrioides]|uniref:Soj/ParA-related ATPase protein n=1 Tax=Brevundimonas subvibrioides (strain ATCC 15264 / DSM 4735 / LMG 14903 / NBRC 16000 / CB 81) TaxID=633149 RepID=D9QJV6_BRESC|nr:ParA family protein [Brevundimonas subvibrioides]ADK99707.1 Soj/ParA-related ATPase protein [Brevundimonas subvibrioides ATCC 15264]
MKTICTMARKGGSGKTTVAVALALTWQRSGKRVLLLDSDPQRSSWAYLHSRTQPGLDVRTTVSGKLFTTKAAAEREGYDILVVDTPAHPEADVSVALTISDYVLVVARPTFLDLAAAAQAIGHLNQIDRPGAIVLNQAPPQRFGEDAPQVRKAKKALQATHLPLIGVLCARRVYQEGLEKGTFASGWGIGSCPQEFERLFALVNSKIGLRPVLPAADSMAFVSP